MKYTDGIEFLKNQNNYKQEDNDLAISIVNRLTEIHGFYPLDFDKIIKDIYYFGEKYCLHDHSQDIYFEISSEYDYDNMVVYYFNFDFIKKETYKEHKERLEREKENLLEIKKKNYQKLIEQANKLLKDNPEILNTEDY